MSDGLLGDEYVNRPDDDELAFVFYEKMFRGPLEKAVADIEAENNRTYYSAYNHFMQTYITKVIATIKALDLPILEYWVNNPSAANDEINFRQVRFDIDSELTQIKIRHAQLIRKGSVRLESDTREKIRDLINKIKITIEGIDLPLARKKSLMGKLNAFAEEVDRDRTRFEAFGALIVEAANVAGKVERKLRPIRKWLDSVANVLHEARAFENAHPRLPAPSKRIQAPVKQIAPPSGDLWSPPTTPKGGDLDDEIPF